MPPALGRLSTTTCWPQLFVISEPIIRARRSVALPAVKGTIMRIGRVGYSAPPATPAWDSTRIAANSQPRICASFRLLGEIELRRQRTDLLRLRASRQSRVSSPFMKVGSNALRSRSFFHSSVCTSRVITLSQ
jgi:hypothetical protein